MATTRQANPVKNIPDWGVDLDARTRPGVPMEREPKVARGVHWTQPERQTPKVEVLKRTDLQELTPVFGTCQPPHGLSGIIRRFAYRIPEHRASHWLLLLVSDRIDALESGVTERIPRRRSILSGTILLGLSSIILLRPKKAH